MNTNTSRDYLAEFLEKGGDIKKLPTKHKILKREAEMKLCEKCKSDISSKRFTDAEGNKYHWCEGCYDE